jgi:hypothetical protein
MILFICISLPSGLRNVDALKRSCVSNYWNQAAKFNREKRGGESCLHLHESRLYNRSRTTRGAARVDYSRASAIYTFCVRIFHSRKAKKKNRTTTERKKFLAFCIHRKALRLSRSRCARDSMIFLLRLFSSSRLDTRSINSRKFAPYERRKDRSKSESTIEGDVKKSIDSKTKTSSESCVLVLVSQFYLYLSGENLSHLVASRAPEDIETLWSAMRSRNWTGIENRNRFCCTIESRYATR